LVLGDSAHSLQVKLDSSRVLDSITRTPLFLAAVVDLHRSGKEIPAKKMGVLGAVMDAIGQHDCWRSEQSATASLKWNFCDWRLANFLQASACCLQKHFRTFSVKMI
jgi:hypothetical protein